MFLGVDGGQAEGAGAGEVMGKIGSGNWIEAFLDILSQRNKHMFVGER